MKGHRRKRRQKKKWWSNQPSQHKKINSQESKSIKCGKFCDKRTPPCGWHCDCNTVVDTHRGWFILRAVPVLSTVFQWCQRKVFECFHSATNVIIGNNGYKAQLEATLQKVQHLETELEVLRSKIKQGHVTNGEVGSPDENHTGCAPRSISVVPRAGEMVLPKEPTPLVPPPPLPPPPPPPPPVPVQKPLNIVIKKNKNPEKPTQSTSKPIVTLDDIKKVKLRRPEERTQNIGPADESIPSKRLRLSSLKTVVQEPNQGERQTPVLTRLKRKPFNRSICDENDKYAALESIVSEVKDYRVKLRKVDIERSPGGTPKTDPKKVRETGSGLTPMMARALKKKFLFARSPSPMT